MLPGTGQVVGAVQEPLPFLRDLRDAERPAFAHPSEEEFASLLDFYCIQWRYEPRSFTLARHPDGSVREAFTPDFYLPQLDVFVELTTMRQSYVSVKKRKLRRMTELYPDVTVRLLYRRDIQQLRATAEGMADEVQTAPQPTSRRVVVSEAALKTRVSDLAAGISGDYRDSAVVMVGVLKGCSFFLPDLARQVTRPVAIDYVSLVRQRVIQDRKPTVRFVRETDIDLRGRDVLVVKDVVNTGLSLDYILKRLKAQRPASLAVCALVVKEGKQIADLPLRHIGFTLPNDYLVGYGLDYREQYRPLPYLAAIDLPPL